MSADWSLARIADIASNIAIGPFGSRMKSDCYAPSGVPVIRGTNLTGGKKFSGNWVFISDAMADQLGNCCVSSGDLVFPHRGSIGEVGIVTDDSPRYVMSSSLMKLSCNRTKADPLYVYYFFKSQQGKLELLKNASQVGTPGIGQPLTSLKGIELPLPPVPVQRDIARILVSLDDKIELNHQVNQTLEQIAQTIFKSWFVNFDPVKAKIEAKAAGRDPERATMCAISGKAEDELDLLSAEQRKQLAVTAALFPDELVESELGLIPVGWEVSCLGIATSLIIDHRGKTPKKLGGDWVETGHPAISAKNIKSGRIVRKDKIRFVDDVLYGKWMKNELEKGDVLLTSEAPLGEMYFLAEKKKIVLSQRLYGLRANKEVSGEYLYSWLSSQLAKTDMEGRSTGTTVIGIRQSELRKVRILVPAPQLVAVFRRMVVPLMMQISVNEAGAESLEKTRDTLLPKLLSGEIILPC